MDDDTGNKTLLINFSSLSLLQISNYVIPLITFPYVVRVLGPSNYGLINFAFAFVTYFTLLVDYGFSFSATRKISKARNNPNELNRIFSTVIAIKIIFSVVLFLIFLLLIKLIQLFNSNYILYYIAFLQVLGFAFFPEWFFQGLEKMQYITIINIFVRTVWVICVFILVSHPGDYLIYALLQSSSILLIGVMGVIVSVFVLGVRLITPKSDYIKEELKEGWNYFISSISISVYTNSSVFILGLFTSNEVVGYFSVADKLRKAFQNILTITSQTIYPRISNLFNVNKVDAIKFLKKYFKFSVILWLGMTLLLVFVSKYLVLIIAGEQYEEAVKIFDILLFLPLIIYFSNYYGIQILVASGNIRIFSKATMVASIVFLLLSFILVPHYLAMGTAFTILFTETLVSVWTYAEVRKRRLLVMSNAI